MNWDYHREFQIEARWKNTVLQEAKSKNWSYPWNVFSPPNQKELPIHQELNSYVLTEDETQDSVTCRRGRDMSYLTESPETKIPFQSTSPLVKKLEFEKENNSPLPCKYLNPSLKTKLLGGTKNETCIRAIREFLSALRNDPSAADYQLKRIRSEFGKQAYDLCELIHEGIYAELAKSQSHKEQTNPDFKSFSTALDNFLDRVSNIQDELRDLKDASELY